MRLGQGKGNHSVMSLGKLKQLLTSLASCPWPWNIQKLYYSYPWLGIAKHWCLALSWCLGETFVRARCKTQLIEAAVCSSSLWFVWKGAKKGSAHRSEFPTLSSSVSIFNSRVFITEVSLVRIFTSQFSEFFLELSV